MAGSYVTFSSAVIGEGCSLLASLRFNALYERRSHHQPRDGHISMEIRYHDQNSPQYGERKTEFCKRCNFILFLFHFSKPLLCVMLICGDWPHFHFIMSVMPDKAAFVSAVLLCVRRYQGNPFLKTTRFNDSESTLLRDNNFIHGALSDLKLCRMFSFT